MPDYGRNEFKLPSLDFMGDPEQLRAQALDELGAAGGRDFRTPDYEEAADGTGSVRVTVDKAGTVKDVHVSQDWRHQMAANRLGPALLEAHQNATRAMMNAVALGRLAEQERQEQDGVDEPAGKTALPHVPEADISQIWRMLSDVEDLMYRVDKMRRGSTEDNIRTLYGPYGFLTARCQGRTITSVTAELTRVEQAGPEQLRQEALELFREAEVLTDRESR